MRPCNNCKRKEHCSVADFLESNYERSPWDLDSHLHSRYAHVSIVTAMAGDKDSIVLECTEHDPIKAEPDYSYLTRRKPKTEPPSSKGGCGGCKGKCGH